MYGTVENWTVKIWTVKIWNACPNAYKRQNLENVLGALIHLREVVVHQVGDAMAKLHTQNRTFRKLATHAPTGQQH